MKLLLFILYTLVPVLVFGQDVEKYLDSLDVTIKNSDFYYRQKEENISQLKRNLHSSVFLQDKYAYSKRIGTEYCKFQTDSALHYFNQCLEYGMQENNLQWKHEATLNKAYVFMLRNEIRKADDLLIELPAIDNIEPELRKLYTEIEVDRIMRLSRNSALNDSAYITDSWDKYSPFADASDISYRDYYMYVVDSCSNDSIDLKLKKYLDDAPSQSFDKALVQYLLSKSAQQKGEQSAALIYAVCAAITDIHTVNNDSQALLDVICMLNKMSNCKRKLERLYNYTRYCSNNIYAIKDLGRSLYLIEQQNEVHKSYQKYISQKESVYTMVIVGCLVAFGICLCALCYLYKRYRQNKYVLASSMDNYRKSESVISELQGKLDENKEETSCLHQLIQRKNASFVESLRIQVGLLNQFTQMRKTILNLLTAGQAKEVKKLLSESLVSNQELNELYAKFDETFLSIHPDFVERFNQLLLPEARIVPESSQKLTIELRIYALVNLGVSDSVSIAKLLNYSQQTIYNYRMKIRHSAIIPEKEFADAVMNLYNTK